MKLKSRELKFRVWDGEKWIYFDLISEGIWDIPDTIFDIETISEYTGLKDKNGKEIYDGDLILAHTDYESENDKYMWNKKNPCIVRWIEKNAGFFPFSLNNRWRCDLKDVEIIGNIKENPELLK